jgi:pimeloyl-ACP methyl ester carboxylesterase
MRWAPLRRVVGASVTAAALVGALFATPASAASLPVNYDFLSGFLAGFGAPNTAPPGANPFFCRPSAAHPHPVILVHGTFENQNDNWQAAAPILANHGYCVYSFNYGGSGSINGLGKVADSANQLSSFVDTVRFWTGGNTVDLVGHSQGGMMPRYYINNLGGASKVDKLIGLAPSNYGTTLDGLVNLGKALGLLDLANGLLANPCAACVDQEIGSPFLTALNKTPTVSSVSYTVIESKGDEVVTPYTNAFLPAAPNVTNILVNDQCAQDNTDHLEIAADPTAMADMLNALDPAHPVTVPCVPVNPITGPTGTVPSF